MATPVAAASELLETARRCSREALSSGALEPLETTSVSMEHSTGPLSVHVLADDRSRARIQRGRTSGGANPFLPYDERVLVSELSETHVCLLNRFPVFDNHLLIVTREWEDQSSPLTQVDFHAMWCGLRQIDGLGFYNAGSASGASQRHRHLQIIPLADVGDAFPWTPKLARASEDAAGLVAGFNFPHAVAAVRPVGSLEGAAKTLFALYCELRERLGLEGSRPAYNLLLTRQWMFLVPRSRESFEGVEINALAFAGSLLLRRREQVELVQQAGLPHFLAAVSGAA